MYFFVLGWILWDALDAGWSGDFLLGYGTRVGWEEGEYWDMWTRYIIISGMRNMLTAAGWVSRVFTVLRVIARRSSLVSVGTCIASRL